MASPAKRQKKNDFEAPTGKVRSLDFFFGKQAEKTNKQQAVKASEPEPTPEIVTDNENEIIELTDEQLARKLQEEWDREDAVQRQVQNGVDGDGGSIPETQATAGTNMTVEEPLEQPAPATEPDGKPHVLSLQASSAAEDTISLTIPFDESPITFTPSKYLPTLQQYWAEEGGQATYALLTRCFVLLSSTQSRIKIVDTLVNFIRTLIEGDPASLLSAVWLATNAIGPPYEDSELGLGGSAISKALKKVCGLDNAGLKALYDKHGDAGDVAFEAKKRQSFTLRKPKPLSIQSVYQSLLKIANSKGTGSQENKQRIVERLLQDARGAEESRYIVRTLCQHLRVGAVKTTMLIALGRAFLLSKPQGADFDISSQEALAKLRKEELAEVYSKAEELVKASFARRPNYNDLVPCLLKIGVSEELLLRCGLALHIPLRPMLGAITRDLGEMLEKLQGRDFSCEYKYDGQRAQVHCDENGKVSIFSRHLEVMTDKYPDLVALVPEIRGEGVSSFILEGEVVAVDPDTGELKPFQILTNRARKDVAIGSIKIQVCLFSFDLMYLNGEPLLDRPFRERRELLRSLFVELPNRFTWVKSIDSTSGDSETVLDFFKSATESKCEGIMVKVLDNLPNPDLLVEQGLADPETTTPSLPATPSKSRKRASKASSASIPNSPSKARQTKVPVLGKSKPTLVGSKSAETPDPTIPAPPSRRKPLPSTYTPDKRSDSWLKVKKDYNSTHSETLDLVPIGGWHGQGRKASWWSPVLLAARDPESGTLVAVTKCMSGFTDEFYKMMRKKYDPDNVGAELDEANNEEIGDDPNANNTAPRFSKPQGITYPSTAPQPDVWFTPTPPLKEEVWEIAFADITLSPTYTAGIGLVNPERGFSLRFPRFLKVRDDKSVEEADGVERLADLYRIQEGKKGEEEKNGKAGKGGVDDDFEY